MKRFFFISTVILFFSPIVSFFKDCPSAFNMASCEKNFKAISSIDKPGVKLNYSDVMSISFIALGDMPYENKEYALYEKLIKKVNLMKPSLVIHAGDAHKEGDCDNKTKDLMRNYMNSFDAPLVFTIGDNDWLDCYEKEFSRMERLNYLRQTHFSSNSTLGKQPFAISNQNQKGYPENMRFEKNNVGFITLHVVGSGNNMVASDPERIREYSERNKANLIWLSESFENLKETDALIIILHANMLKIKRNPFREFTRTIKKDFKLLLNASSYVTLYEDIVTKAPFYSFKLPYQDIGLAIQTHSLKFRKPVLLIHGDTHKHRSFRPAENVPNLYLFETYGTPHIKASKIAVWPNSNYPFRIEQTVEPN